VGWKNGRLDEICAHCVCIWKYYPKPHETVQWIYVNNDKNAQALHPGSRWSCHLLSFLRKWLCLLWSASSSPTGIWAVLRTKALHFLSQPVSQKDSHYSWHLVLIEKLKCPMRASCCFSQSEHSHQLMITCDQGIGSERGTGHLNKQPPGAVTLTFCVHSPSYPPPQ
jgi:hypothetical protein